MLRMSLHVLSVENDISACVFIRSLNRYRSNSQWTDGTIAYMFEIQQKLPASRTWERCSRIDLESPTFNDFHLILISCETPAERAYVCEKELKVEKRIGLQMPVLPRNEEIQVIHFSTCPAGHVTYNFLSCDLQAACMPNHTSSIFFCESSLLPPPPMFKCSNQMEHVPYPLVCDYRPDCRDHSDENFCIFPSCSGESFQCGNKQVRKILVNTQRLLTSLSKICICFCCTFGCFMLLWWWWAFLFSFVCFEFRVCFCSFVCLFVWGFFVLFCVGFFFYFSRWPVTDVACRKQTLWFQWVDQIKFTMICTLADQHGDLNFLVLSSFITLGNYFSILDDTSLVFP